MKKLLCLILACVMCAALSACASKEEKAFEAANALLEAGDYQGALDAYNAIGLYVSIQEKVYQAKSMGLAHQISPYVGTWIDLKGDAVVTVNPDGTYHFSDGVEEYTAEAVFSGDTLSLGILSADTRGGILHLVSGRHDLVREEDIEALRPREIAITRDNWDTYFTLREAYHVSLNAFGDVEWADFGAGVFLKEEYAARLAEGIRSCQVTFKVRYTPSTRYLEGTYPQGDFALGEEFVHPWFDCTDAEITVDVSCLSHEGDRRSDFYQQYAAQIPGTINEWDTPPFAVVPTDIRVLDVTGSLTLLP